MKQTLKGLVLITCLQELAVIQFILKYKPKYLLQASWKVYTQQKRQNSSLVIDFDRFKENLLPGPLWILKPAEVTDDIPGPGLLFSLHSDCLA